MNEQVVNFVLSSFTIKLVPLRKKKNAAAKETKMFDRRFFFLNDDKSARVLFVMKKKIYCSNFEPHLARPNFSSIYRACVHLSGLRDLAIFESNLSRTLALTLLSLLRYSRLGSGILV